MLTEIIDADSAPFCGSNSNMSKGILYLISYFHLCKKNILCDVYGLRSPSFESSSMIYYTYLYLFHAGINNARNATKIRNDLLLDPWHVESKCILQLRRISLLFLIVLDT